MQVERCVGPKCALFSVRPVTHASGKANSRNVEFNSGSGLNGVVSEGYGTVSVNIEHNHLTKEREAKNGQIITIAGV